MKFFLPPEHLETRGVERVQMVPIPNTQYLIHVLWRDQGGYWEDLQVRRLYRSPETEDGYPQVGGPDPDGLDWVMWDSLTPEQMQEEDPEFFDLCIEFLNTADIVQEEFTKANQSRPPGQLEEIFDEMVAPNPDALRQQRIQRMRAQAIDEVQRWHAELGTGTGRWTPNTTTDNANAFDTHFGDDGTL